MIIWKSLVTFIILHCLNQITLATLVGDKGKNNDNEEGNGKRKEVEIERDIQREKKTKFEFGGKLFYFILKNNYNNLNQFN